MNLMKRLTITATNQRGEEMPITSATEIDFDNPEQKLFLRLDGKPTHRLVQCSNADPQDIVELDSKVILLMPLQPWCALCRNKKAYMEGLGMYRLSGEETVPAALVVESDLFNDKDERPNVLNGLIEKINSHMKPLVSTIEKTPGRAR